MNGWNPLKNELKPEEDRLSNIAAIDMQDLQDDQDIFSDFMSDLKSEGSIGDEEFPEFQNEMLQYEVVDLNENSIHISF